MYFRGMRTVILLIPTLFTIACNNNTPNCTNKIIQTIDTATVKETNSALDSLHPNNLSKDLSWIVSLDIQEGFLLSYTITYQSGEEITKPIDEYVPVIGGVNHPEPHFINDTTYFVPNMGASKNGHYEMYIFYSGRAEYKEITQEN